jgi:hypothetical protein
MDIYLDTALDHVISYLLKSFNDVDVPTIFQMVYERNDDESQIAVYQDCRAHDSMRLAMQSSDDRNLVWLMSDIAEEDAKKIQSKLILGLFVVALSGNEDSEQAEANLIIEGRGLKSYNAASLRTERFVTNGSRRNIKRRITGEYNICKSNLEGHNMRFKRCLNSYMSFYNFSIESESAKSIMEKFQKEITR